MGGLVLNQKAVLCNNKAKLYGLSAWNSKRHSFFFTMTNENTVFRFMSRGKKIIKKNKKINSWFFIVSKSS